MRLRGYSKLLLLLVCLDAISTFIGIHYFGLLEFNRFESMLISLIGDHAVFMYAIFEYLAIYALNKSITHFYKKSNISYITSCVVLLSAFLNNLLSVIKRIYLMS